MKIIDEVVFKADNTTETLLRCYGINFRNVSIRRAGSIVKGVALSRKSYRKALALMKTLRNTDISLN
jgi:hypothetical protein